MQIKRMKGAGADELVEGDKFVFTIKSGNREMIRLTLERSR